MKCPLSITGNLTGDGEFIGAAADCLKEECAWWDEEKNLCSLKVMAKELSRLQRGLQRKEE